VVGQLRHLSSLDAHIDAAEAGGVAKDAHPAPVAMVHVAVPVRERAADEAALRLPAEVRRWQLASRVAAVARVWCRERLKKHA